MNIGTGDDERGVTPLAQKGQDNLRAVSQEKNVRVRVYGTCNVVDYLICGALRTYVCRRIKYSSHDVIG